MTPTTEQIEIVAQAVAAVQTADGCTVIVIDEDRAVAREAFLVIAPMVLEAAAATVEDTRRTWYPEDPDLRAIEGALDGVARRIRALK